MAAVLLTLSDSNLSAADIRKHGALGFPQESATVLCDSEELRLSASADKKFLYLQAVLWNDHENASGKGIGESTVSDNCTFGLLLSEDGKPKKGDPQYSLNTSEGRLPISVSRSLGGDVITAASKKTGARGRIAFIKVDGKKVRVDSIAIPLEELDVSAEQSVRVAYYGRSFSPDARYTSLEISADEKKSNFDFAHLPRDRFTALTLKEGPELDVSKLSTSE